MLLVLDLSARFISTGFGRRNVDCVGGVVYGVSLKSDSRVGGWKMSTIPKEPEQVMKQRDGYVLGKKTILKSDHFPGCHNKRLYPHIDGAPNYRQLCVFVGDFIESRDSFVLSNSQADKLHVHGVAIPTIDGIRNVLTHIGAQMDGKQANVLWINLREEPVGRISRADLKTEIIFNCQMGRGRTTTGMVIATLIYFNRMGASGIPRNNSIGQVSRFGSNATDNMLNTDEALLRGEYTVIRSLIRVLEGGVEGKRQVDKVIDKCSSMQNLREAIATYRNSILRQPDEMKREALLSFFVEYLERYYYLICFAVYLHTERAVNHPTAPAHFYDWMKARPELYTIIRRLLRRDPMGALGYANIKPFNKLNKGDGHPSEMGIVAVSRTGEVLGSQTVLKSDHCPGCQQLYLPERVEGAPNFREIPGFPVYGVANPTVEGIKSVIQRIGSSKYGRPVFWHNMREEPVIYINGKPFVLREVERPYKNMLEYTGIDRERVERMEARLKEDILKESERYGGDIMVIHETEDGKIYEAWEHVSIDAVQTPLEVFKSLEADGFPIKYARVPTTDGKAPKSSDFDKLALNISSAPKDTAFVFNCQMGRGRTTTGTVIACLLKLRIDHGRPIRVLLDDVACGAESDNGSSSGDESGADPVSKGRTRVDASHAFGINDILLLWKITRFFENGVECREALDAVIDRCSALQNIRQAVLRYRKLFNQQHTEPRERRVALNRGAEYLERYFRLIAFAAYLGSEAFDGFCGQGDSKITFKSWLRQRPEVQAMKWSIRLRPGRFFTVPEELRAPQESQHGDAVMESIVKKRNGSVLGKGSILKMYFFPGQRTSSNIQIHGAPHVYKVDGYPIYCMATPTISGAKEMLAYLGARPTSERNGPQKVILTDLREEAVVYINDTPFVLRELNKPVDTLKHVGITGSVVEHMEARLKEDIISEIKKCGGRMLLHREEFNPTLNQANVVGYWENIFVEDVKTPTEVYAALRDDGYDIVFRRIPLTREREALASDVDAVQDCMDDNAGSYLFVSHTGFGGVAYAMAIICIKLQSEGKLALPALADNQQLVSSDAREKGDYRDILSLTRVLVDGPESKSDVDIVIDRCAGAGHLRDDILCYSKELEEFDGNDDDRKAYIMDMGIKALRRYFLLIMFRSYIYSTSTTEMKFTTWMKGRPELGHLYSLPSPLITGGHKENRCSGSPSEVMETQSSEDASPISVQIISKNRQGKKRPVSVSPCQEEDSESSEDDTPIKGGKKRPVSVSPCQEEDSESSEDDTPIKGDN
nr:paladin isoform X1 [Tanacetum cinerariifolium]